MFEIKFDKMATKEIKQSQKHEKLKIKIFIDYLKEYGLNIQIGHLEKLKGQKNIYSLEINDKDRLVFEFDNDKIYILSCKNHYSDH